MRNLLPTLMAILTRHPRQIVVAGKDFNWDGGNSRLWQVFRAYEVIFGRRDGIRFEGSSWLDHGKSYYTFGTWENLFVFGEHLIRQFFKGLAPKFEIIRVPQLITPSGVRIDSPFRFAIAFDATNIAATTSVSLTVTGSNPFMFACGGYSASAAAITGAFNSVAMTSSATQIWIGSSNPINGIYLAGPTTGTNTLAITNGNGGCAIGVTYSGVAQVTPDQYVTSSSAGTTVTETATTATANCWMVMIVIGSNNTPTAGTNATGRSLNSAGLGLNSIFDSNGNIATGSFAMTVNGFSAQACGGVAYKFVQVAATAIINTSLLTLLGVG